VKKPLPSPASFGWCSLPTCGEASGAQGFHFTAYKSVIFSRVCLARKLLVQDGLGLPVPPTRLDSPLVLSDCRSLFCAFLPEVPLIHVPSRKGVLPLPGFYL